VRKRVLISAVDLVGYVQGALRPYIGVAADIADHRPLVEVVLDHYCYGRNMTHRQSVVEMVCGYGIPTDVARTVEETLTRDLLTVIQTGFGLIYPCRYYRYQWFNDGDVLVDEFLEIPADFDDIELVLEPMDSTEGMGDYVPERLRRG
jgi:hypothetical protein